MHVQLSMAASRVQPSLLSYRDKLNSLNFAYIKLSFHTFKIANNKKADQTVWMHVSQGIKVEPLYEPI